MADLHAHYEANAEKQDKQGWYEDAALAVLSECGRFEEARHIVEAGCGTGRFARTILESQAPKSVRYTGIDFSQAMLSRAEEKLKPLPQSVTLTKADIRAPLSLNDASCDRFIATYLFDLLSEDETQQLLAEAHRVLEPGGYLCIASLTREPCGVLPGLANGFWLLTAKVFPARVGGCRPVAIAPCLNEADWDVITDETVVAGGLASQAIVAKKR